MEKPILIALLLSCLSLSAQNRREAFFRQPDVASANLAIVNAWSNGLYNVVLPVTVAPTTGNLLVAGIVAGATNTVVSNNVAGGDTQWSLCCATNFVGGNFVSIWYCKNVPAGVTKVTTFATGAGYQQIIVQEVSGASASSPFTSSEATATNNNNVATTTPLIGPISNGTANSIFFAFIANDAPGNPAILTLNGAGTVGTWALFSTTICQNLDGGNWAPSDMPNIIVSSTTAEKHVWGTGSFHFAACLAAFH